MRPIAFLAAIVVAVSLSGTAQAQTLTWPQLKTMVENLGYTTSVLEAAPGKEKFVFNTSAGDLNIPVGGEVSASTRYVWLTINLGTPPAPADQLLALLRSNAAIQPNFFYVTASGRLMLAVHLDNRQITPAELKRVIDDLLASVVSQKPIWQPGH